MAKVRLLDPTDPRRRLDRYELIGELASGGMATVFLGRLGGVGGFSRFVAVKQLHPHLASEEEFIEMFLDEARLAAGIHHPHVVPILEVGQSANGYYLVMEYIEGDTLARIMARSLAMAKPVPRPVLLRVVLDALSGLHAAHELCDPHGNPVQLVHRDVSPQNVLVGVDGCSRITDFGVAHAASRLSNSRADRLKGKLAYMSPEQARAGNVDRRADVFAMGIILWEVLAAKRLFKGETEAVTLQKVLSEPIPRLAAVAQGVHPALDQVCARALERDAALRYRTAAEMAEALERAARAASPPSDTGVASPRDVAAYAQAALGEDIAAQRESVRAWLSHSEASGIPTVGGVRPGEISRGATSRPRGEAVYGGAASGPTPRAPGEAVYGGAASREPVYGGAASRAPAEAVYGGAASGPVPGLKPVYDVTFKMPLDRPASARPQAASDSGESTDPGMPPIDDDDDDDDEDGETQLMDRDAPNAQVLAALALRHKTAPARPALPADGTPSASIGAIEMPPPLKPSRVPQIVALVVGILIAVGGVLIWWQLDSEKAPAPAESSSAPGAAVPPKPPDAPAPSPAVTPPAPTATTVPSATTTTTPAPVPAGRWPFPGSRKPKGKPLPAPAPEAAPVPAPKPEAPKPEAPKPPDEMANPYRAPGQD